MLITLVTALALSVTDVAWQVETTQGNLLTGTLIALDDQQVQLRTPDGDQTIALDTVVRLGGPAATATAKPAAPDTDSPPAADEAAGKEAAVRVTLADGSQWFGTQFVTEARQSIVLLPDTDRMAVDTRWVRHVRLKKPDPAVDEKWQEIAAESYDSDVLVIRKPGPTLDFFKGIVEQVQADGVAFQFDGQNIDVSLDKVEGIVFFSNAPPLDAKPRCRLTTALGSQIQAKSIRLANGQLVVTTLWGDSLELAPRQVRSIDYSSGKIAYLSDLEPATEEVYPLIHSSNPQALYELLYRPRRDDSILGGGLRLAFDDQAPGQTTYRKGLGLHSKTELVYRLDGQFARLQGMAGIDPRVREDGHVELTILGDGQPLWNAQIAGTDAPHALDVDISGVRRLAIVVDYGNDIDIGDHLNLCELKVTQ